MNRESRGVELLLGEPEIVAWLGLGTRDDLTAQRRRELSVDGNRSRADRPQGRASDENRTTARSPRPRLGLAL